MKLDEPQEREAARAMGLSPEEARAQGEADVQAKIAEMAEDDRAIAALVDLVHPGSLEGGLASTVFSLRTAAE